MAWASLTTPLRAKKGIRLTVFGITGKGKTTGLVELVDYIVDGKLVDLVIIHDVKYSDRQQYRGAVIHEARDLYTDEHAPNEYPSVAVLRKRDLDHMPSVDQAARVTLESADAKVTTLLLVDEGQRAFDEDLADIGGFRKGSTMRISCEGFGLGASLILSKQLPQHTQSEIRDQSDLVLFGLASKGVSHLVDDKVLDAKTAEVVSRLDVGDFVVIPAEGDWDGYVNQVPKP